MSQRYRTIVADPPWPIKWTGGSRRAGASSGSTRVYEKKPLPYETMSIEDLERLPVPELVDPVGCCLFMWTLDRFVLDGSASRVARAWGFDVNPQMIVWRKANAGLGRYLRPAHELILIGTRGIPLFRPIATTSVHNWRQPYENGAKVHSAKPEGALDLIESLSEGPYAELFARRARFGWDYPIGDQALGGVAA